MHRRRVTALGASLLLLAALLPTATAAQPVTKSGPHQFTKAGNYIVRMADLPGRRVRRGHQRLQGHQAERRARRSIRSRRTSPSTSAISMTSTKPRWQRAGGGKKLYDYAFSYNGFLAKLTDGQAAQLGQRSPASCRCQPNEIVRSTPRRPIVPRARRRWRHLDQLGGGATTPATDHHR